MCSGICFCIPFQKNNCPSGSAIIPLLKQSLMKGKVLSSTRKLHLFGSVPSIAKPTIVLIHFSQSPQFVSRALSQQTLKCDKYLSFCPLHRNSVFCCLVSSKPSWITLVSAHEILLSIEGGDPYP